MGNSNFEMEYKRYLFDATFTQEGEAATESREGRVEHLRNEIRALKNALPAHGFPAIGDLFSTDLSEVEATIACVVAMLHQRQKDIEFRNEVYERIQKLENDRTSLNATLEKLTAQKRTLENESNNLGNKLRLTEKTAREEREKLLTEKEELRKQLAAIQGREGQFICELRKRDNQYKALQDQLKKIPDKGITYKNSIELSNVIEAKGPVLFSGNSDNEFTYMITKGYEEVHNKLLSENEVLRESLAAVQRELNEIVAARREMYLRRRRIEHGDEMVSEEMDSLEGQVLPLRRELFNMPVETVGKEALECLQENIRRFREFMRRMDVLSKEFEDEMAGPGDEELEKIKCVRSLRLLLKNYKYVVESQDVLLNKSIVKANGYRPVEDFSHKFSKLRLMNDDELERTRQFLAEQKNFLEEKNREIEMTKKMMNVTAKKLEDERSLIMQRRTEIEEETEKFKRGLEEVASRNKAFFEELGSLPEQRQARIA
eukprot:TRINITY_DN5925_c0_g3_i2.p1 TRINITY_DN5925_c0_g3~~TRINITY_DN5925_c0_g3_i2.p1  ORF type:complete len:488 (+),score=172.57 TRINITY_DN5925_c0_g3_i2:100-1563(+)